MLYFGYGVMGAAKTLNALKIVFDYENKGKPVMLLSNTDEVSSRVGMKHSSYNFKDISAEKFDDMMKQKEYAAIIIDEVQFCPKELLVHIITMYLDYHIYCYGLLNTSNQGLFPNSEMLYKHADIRQEFYSVCEYCNNLAKRHAAIDDKGRIILSTKDVLRPKSSYVSLCNSCYERIDKVYDT